MKTRGYKKLMSAYHYLQSCAEAAQKLGLSDLREQYVSAREVIGPIMQLEYEARRTAKFQKWGIAA